MLVDGVADIMRDRWWRVDDYKGGAKPADTDRFRNRRMDVYWTLWDQLEPGEIAIVRNADLWRELLAVRWSSYA